MKLYISAGLLAALMLAAPWGGADPTVLSNPQVSASVNSPAVRQQVTQLDDWARQKDTDALWAAVAAMESLQDPDPVVKPYLRHYAVMRLAQVPETSAARAGLARYLAASEFVQVWFDDGGHRVPVRTFDLASAARFALGNWNRRAWFERTRQDLAKGRTDFLDSWSEAALASGGMLASDGIQDALAQASAASLELVRQALENRLLRGEPVAAIARTVAVGLQDTRLAREVLSLGDSAEALAMLDGLGSFSESQQLDLLETALTRHELGSAAIYQLGASPLPRAERLLMAKLDSKALGGSAAAALGRKANPALVEDLADVVRDQSRPAAQLRAVLALRLAPDGMGLGALKALAGDSRVSPAVRGEIARRLP